MIASCLRLALRFDPRRLASQRLASRRCLCALAALSLLIGCGGTRRPTVGEGPNGKGPNGEGHNGEGHKEESHSGAVQRGVASWYGKPFHGRPTASGEIYDMHALTAAHRSLPLGTVVRVTRLDNRRSVTVRINDRGPFVRGRIIDLSRAAAAALDMLEDGVATVELRVLEHRVPAAGNAVEATRFAVQAGAFKDRDNALALKRTLAADFPQVEIISSGGLHRVRVGSYGERRQAERARRKLRARGIEAFIIRQP